MTMPDAPLTTVEKAAFLIGVDLFREVPSDALADLATRVEATSHEPGEVVLEPDAADARLLVVIEGRLQVMRDGTHVCDLGSGDAVGLLAILGLPHRDTVVATQRCRCLAIAPDDYMDALADNPAFALSNLRALGRRLQQAEADVSASPLPESRPAGGTR